ncbi:hypothetical protein GGS20DRAFT_436037 [Poronia punctata]|nr:hypothetical protein GGS20DRAFT_436037 [Poronia punctata]
MYIQIHDGSDLIALAMAHSAFFELAMSKLYSWFDICWTPSAAEDDGKGVDALSYGLATLALPNRFAQSISRLRGPGPGRLGLTRQVANHDYASYVRTFSISNGPPDVTSEYSIARESGKMLCTLVALALSKMAHLESFIWDTDSGILSDIFMALSSLEDEHGESQLGHVWIRLHDRTNLNTPSSSSSSSPTMGLPAPPAPLAITQTNNKLSTAIGNYVYSAADTSVPETKKFADISVQYPTFSILPPLKSLTVLNIDDISYLDELSILIERSAPCLVDLSVGLSASSCSQDFALPWDGPDLQQVDHEAKWPGESKIPLFRLGGVLGILVGRIYDIRRKPKTEVSAKSQPVAAEEVSDTGREGVRLDGKLKLRTLALERVAISPGVMVRAIDWSNMTSLTILDCIHSDTLWKILRKHFQPTPLVRGAPQKSPVQYRLSLKQFHVDPVSPSFITFVRETLAPNTLDTLYLHDQRHTTRPLVTADQIFNTIVKRHRSSIENLLINCPNNRGSRDRYKRWVVEGDFLAYIMSGKMKSLRALGIVMNRKDWHKFIRHLPQMATLRALYIPRIVGYHLDAPRELAMSIMDTVSLRREIQLVHIGLLKKCYEIYEGDPQDGGNDAAHEDDGDSTSDSSSSTSDEPEATDNGLTEGSDDGIDGPFEYLSDDGQSHIGHLGAATRPLRPLRLREIVCCEDEAEIFRVRHGRL